jgi:RNA polymerase sigma factor (sigma-70 family)
MVINYVLKNSGDEDEARDLFQDAIVVLWQKVSGGDFVLTSKISTFLFGVCQNIWQKELKRKLKNSGEMQEGSHEIELDKEEKIRIIHESLNKLGASCKEILVYYYFENRNMTDIAELMGFGSSDTAKSKKYKCKQELDRYIKENYKVGDVLD